MHGSSLASIMSHHHDLVNFFRVSCVSNFDVSLWNISKPCKSTSFWGSNFAIAMVSDKVVIQTQISAFFLHTASVHFLPLFFTELSKSVKQNWPIFSTDHVLFITTSLSLWLLLSVWYSMFKEHCSWHAANVYPTTGYLLKKMWRLFL